MKLSQCVYGTIVVDKERDRIGMIKGITNNRQDCSYYERSGIDHAIPLVEWSDGNTHGIHHENIEKFKG